MKDYPMLIFLFLARRFCSSSLLCECAIAHFPLDLLLSTSVWIPLNDKQLTEVTSGVVTVPGALDEELAFNYHSLLRLAQILRSTVMSVIPRWWKLLLSRNTPRAYGLFVTLLAIRYASSTIGDDA